MLPGSSCLLNHRKYIFSVPLLVPVIHQANPLVTDTRNSDDFVLLYIDIVKRIGHNHKTGLSFPYNDFIFHVNFSLII